MLEDETGAPQGAPTEPSGYVTLYMTAENEDAANHIAMALVNERLVACANILTGIRSIFEWDGLLEFQNEVAALMKTRSDKAEDAIARIRELHNYEVPCITCMPIEVANPDYLAWIDQQLEKAPKKIHQ